MIENGKRSGRCVGRQVDRVEPFATVECACQIFLIGNHKLIVTCSAIDIKRRSTNTDVEDVVGTAASY